MSSWSLFLSDSLNLDKQLEHCCVEIVTRTVNLTSSLIAANLPSPAPSPGPIFRYQFSLVFFVVCMCMYVCMYVYGDYNVGLFCSLVRAGRASRL